MGSGVGCFSLRRHIGASFVFFAAPSLESQDSFLRHRSVLVVLPRRDMAGRAESDATNAPIRLVDGPGGAHLVNLADNQSRCTASARGKAHTLHGRYWLPHLICGVLRPSPSRAAFQLAEGDRPPIPAR